MALASVRAEVLHVDVSAQPGVVGEVPAIVIRIVVDHDLIAVPQPVAAVGESNAATLKKNPPNQNRPGPPPPRRKTWSRPNPPGNALLERMIDVIVAIVTTRVMSNPIAVRVHVRRIWMSLAVAERVVFAVHFRPTMKAGWDRGPGQIRPQKWPPPPCAPDPPPRMTAAASATLRKRWDRTHAHHRDERSVLFSCLPPEVSRHLRIRKASRRPVGHCGGAGVSGEFPGAATRGPPPELSRAHQDAALRISAHVGIGSLGTATVNPAPKRPLAVYGQKDVRNPLATKLPLSADAAM